MANPLHLNAARRQRLLSSALIVGIASSSAPTAFAQEQETFSLEEIVVTAQRKEESLQRAAIAIDVVSSEQLAESGVTSSSQLNQLVPSLTVQQAGGANTSYFVRGVGNFTQNGFSDPALAFNVDGVYLGRSTSSTGTFYDLQRIEVLKGPQGTLYGRNATSGAINVLPNKPDLKGFSGNASVGYGNYNAVNLQGTLNLPVSDTSAFRIAANYVDRDGFNDDGTQDESGTGARAQYLFKPSDTFDIRLAADYSHQGGKGPGAALDGRYVLSRPAGQPVNTFEPSGLSIDGGIQSPQSLALFTSTYAIGGAFIFPAAPRAPSMDNQYWGVTAEVNVDTAIGKLTVIPAYRDSHLDFGFNGPSFQLGLVDETATQSSLEARLQGKRIGIFDWLLGAYYFDEKVDGLNSYNQYVVTAYLDYVSKTESTAFFTRLTANFTDDVRLVLGARYTKDDKSMDGRARTLIQRCGPFPPPAGPPVTCFGPNGSSLPIALQFSDLTIPLPATPGSPATQVPFGANPNSRIFYSDLIVQKTPTFEKTTFRIAPEWDVTETSLLYASYETGYRSGGFALADGKESFQPETINALTLGSKNRFLNNRLQVNLELFQWKYNDQQVSHFGADRVGNSGFFTENIGKTDISGVDVEGQFLATANTLLSFTTQYLKSEVKQFSFRQLDSGTGIVTGCKTTSVSDRNVNGIPGNEAEFIVDCSGKRGYNSPEWSVDLGIEQTIPLNALNLVLSADTAYRGESVNGFDYLPEQINKAHWTSNASVALKQGAGAWSVSAYVRNIEDKRYKTATQYSGSTGGSVNTWYSAPLTFGVRGSVSF